MTIKNVNSTPSTINRIPSGLFNNPEYKGILFRDDILAYALANMKNVLTIFYDKTKCKSPTKEHYERSAAIREYYHNRFVLENLKGVTERSRYRQTLYDFVAGNIDKPEDEDFQQWSGFLVRLVEFYEYDLEIDQLAEDFNTSPFDREELPGSPIKLNPIQIKCKLVTVLTRESKKEKVKEYWFYESKTDRLCRVALDIQNPLMNLFNLYLKKRNGEAIIDGSIFPSKMYFRPDFNYYNVTLQDILEEN